MPDLRLYAVSFLDLYRIDGTPLRKVWAEAGHLITPTPRAVLAARILAPRSPIPEVLAALEAEGFAFTESEFRSEIDAGLAELGDAWRALEWRRGVLATEEIRQERAQYRRRQEKLEANRWARKLERKEPARFSVARRAWAEIASAYAELLEVERADDRYGSVFDGIEAEDDPEVAPALHWLVEASQGLSWQMAGAGMSWRPRQEFLRARRARRSPRVADATTLSGPRVTSAPGS